MTGIVSIIRAAYVTIPVSELVLMLVALSLCLLFRFIRIGLIIAYLFTFHIGWLFCEKELLGKSLQLESCVVVYFFFGGMVLFLALVGMLRSTK